MANPKPKPKLTFADLRALGHIPSHTIDEMERLAIRCLQITEETKILESEYGFRDHQGRRHPGVVDELEALMIQYDLTDSGLRIENYTVIYAAGSTPPRQDEHLLLAEGVAPEVIARCRVSTPWAGVQFRRDPAHKHKGKDEPEE